VHILEAQYLIILFLRHGIIGSEPNTEFSSGGLAWIPSLYWRSLGSLNWNLRALFITPLHEMTVGKISMKMPP